MNNNDFLLKTLTFSYKETPKIWAQCVFLNKMHSQDVYWIKLWNFNWAANKATYKIGWTYDPRYWDKLVVWVAPLQQWDHLIQNTGKYWHIGIVYRQANWWYYLHSQNNWNGNGDGFWSNSCLITWYDYKTPILYIFRRRI